MNSQQVNNDGALTMSMTQFEAYVSELNMHDSSIIHNFDMYLEEDKVVTDDNLLINLLPPETVNNLQEKVKHMVTAGFEKECCHVYSSCRKQFLQKCIFQLQFKKFKRERLQKWNRSPQRVQRWIRFSQIALRILFPCERRLCQNIFYGFSSAKDLAFTEVCRELTNDILSFPTKLTIEIYSLDDLGIYLGRILSSCLKVFQTLGDFIPDFESVFSDDYSASLKNEVIMSWKRLGETIMLVFMELENHICLDMAQKPVPNGGIDPIIYHVTSCLSAIFDGTLDQIFKEYPIPIVAGGDRKRRSSSCSTLMDQIMENSEAKSNYYTDPALGYVFLLNNYRYILLCGKDELEIILGDDWLRKHDAELEKNLEHYQRTWDKVLDILKLDGNESAESMKEKLKLFNKEFKEMCIVQSTWFVLNEQLREQLRTPIQDNLLQSYGNFIARFQGHLGKHAYQYIEYGMYDIDALLNDLFRGSEIRSSKTGKRSPSKAALSEKSD